MKKFEWFDRTFTFGLPMGMLPFYLERLEGSLTRLERKVSAVTEEVLSTRLDHKWSVKQNIGHLAEVDEISLRRIDEMIQGTSPLSPAVVQPRQDYNAQPVQQVLAYFNTTRRKNIERYGNLTDDMLLKSSLHPRLKVMMTPVDLAWFDAEHDDHHIVRINEIIKTLTQ